MRNETETTFIDELFQCIKPSKRKHNNLSGIELKETKYILDADGYDSEAVQMDILQNDKSKSNLFHLINNSNHYILIQQHIRENVKRMFFKLFLAFL